MNIDESDMGNLSLQPKNVSSCGEKGLDQGVSRISQAEYIPKFANGRVNVLLWLKWGIMWNVELGCWLLNKEKVDEGDKRKYKHMWKKHKHK